MFKRFSTVLIKDCTYKTNRFNMPLLNLVGITNLNTTFEIGMAWLSGETESDYLWACNAFASIFVSEGITSSKVILTDSEQTLINAIKHIEWYSDAYHMLCLWYIEQNIMKHCRKRKDHLYYKS